jgi:hypothetical protein
MMFRASLRELPIRIPITEGESLQSWIEASAARYKMTVRELLPALGLPAPRTAYGLVLDLDPQVLRNAEWQAGLPAGRLDEAMLDRFASLGLACYPTQEIGRPWESLWARAAGASFCPRCLTENGGRWALSWYLKWTFACTRHNVLMAMRCDACGRIPRTRRENRLDHIIDARRCCQYSLEALTTGSPHRSLPRCGASLAGQVTEELGADHPIIACQKWIDGILFASQDVTVAGLRVPPKAALAAVSTLMRAAVVIPDSDLATRRVNHVATGLVSEGIALPMIEPSGSANGMYGAVSDCTALFGAVAALACDVLATPSLAVAAEAMLWMVPHGGRRIKQSRGHWPLHLESGSTGIPVVDAIMLRHREPAMSPAFRLSYRTRNATPRRPADSADAAGIGEWPFPPGCTASVPARLVPQVAWKPLAEAFDWQTSDTGVVAATLSMAIVRCGTYAEWDHIAAWLCLPPRLGDTATNILYRMNLEGHLDKALTGIDALVEELIQHPPPIDYARRRWVFRNLDPVTPARLRRALHVSGMALSDRRRRFATMLLWETMTGGDVRFANGRQKPIGHTDRQEYASFRNKCGSALADYIALEGERLLLYNNINEPVTWQPEPEDSAGQAWLSAPADMTRHLPGWQAPSRQERLRRSSRDYTPPARWGSRLDRSYGAAERESRA